METAYYANDSQKKTVLLDKIGFKVKSIKTLHDKWYNSSRYNNYDLKIGRITRRNRQSPILVGSVNTQLSYTD